jgi:hypothetical protein
MSPLFAAGNLDKASATRLAFVCDETNPLKGAAAIRAQLVQAARNRGVSDATREWAVLGWYEMAAFSVLRAHCCPSPPPLDLPETSSKRCAPLDRVLNELTEAVAASSDPEDPAVEKAARGFTRTVQCVVRVGEASRYGRVGKPDGGEETAFRKTLARVTRQKR